MICFTSSLIRQLYYLATDFDRVLLQMVGSDKMNTLCKYRVSCSHLTFLIERLVLLMKSCEKFHLLFMNIHCARLLEKVTFEV